MACKSPSNLLEFSGEVTTRLLEHCSALKKDKSTRRFSRKLEVELFFIQYWLDDNSDDPRIEGDKKAQRRVESLLGKFRDICTVSQALIAVFKFANLHIPSGYPRTRLRKMARDSAKSSREIQVKEMTPVSKANTNGLVLFYTPQDLSNSPDRQQARQSYPFLYELLDSKTPIPHGLKSYARLGCTEDQNLRLGTLRKFVRGDKHVRLPVEDEDEDSPLEDYSSHICHLYEAVSKHCLCQRREESEDPIVANVHLGRPDERSSTEEESSSDECSDSDDFSSVASSDTNSDPPVNFHILFLSHPHGPVSSNVSRWRDTRIAVPRPKKRVQISDWVHSSMLTDQSSGAMWKGRQARSKKARLINEHEDGFCGLISSPEPVWHPLVFEEGQLRFKGPRRYSRTFQLDTPSIPLREIVRLRREDFTEKKRFVLSYLLSRAVWQYYESDWMIRGWTKDAVHFMYETRDDESGLFVDEPFLHNDPLTSADNDDADMTKQIHKFPKILALGIMLIEINLGIRIEDERTDKSYVDGRLTANADAIIAEDISNNKKRLREYSDHLTSAIKFCTNPRKVIKKLSSKSVPDQREHLYKHVVTPLRRLCERSFQKNLNITAINLPQPASLYRQVKQSAEVDSDTNESQFVFSTPLHLADIRSQSANDLGQSSR